MTPQCSLLNVECDHCIKPLTPWSDLQPALYLHARLLWLAKSTQTLRDDTRHSPKANYAISYVSRPAADDIENGILRCNRPAASNLFVLLGLPGLASGKFKDSDVRSKKVCCWCRGTESSGTHTALGVVSLMLYKQGKHNRCHHITKPLPNSCTKQGQACMCVSAQQKAISRLKVDKQHSCMVWSKRFFALQG